jgi:hypothetical protein
MTRLFVVFALLFSSCAHSHIEPTQQEGAVSTRLVFDSGRGTGQYDEMTYAKYWSDVTFVPEVNMPVRSLYPQMSYCNGSCGYLSVIKDEYGIPLASQSGLIDTIEDDKPMLPERFLNTSIELSAGVTYRISMEVWTTKSVGIYTTGNRTSGVSGRATYTTHQARSDTANHLDRGAIAFLLVN